MFSQGRTDRRVSLVQLSLAPAVLWASAIVLTAAALFRGSTPPVLNLVLVTLPGFAYVPAVITTVRLRRAAGPEDSDALMFRALTLSGIGFAVLVAAVTIMSVTGSR